MRGVVGLNGPACNSHLAAIGAGFNNQVVILDYNNRANDTANRYNLVSDLQIRTHTCSLLVTLFLRTDQHKVKNNKNKDQW